MLLDWLIRKKVAAFEQELLQKYYAEVDSMYTKMRGWRHDYRHHIQTLKVHASKGEMDEVHACTAGNPATVYFEAVWERIAGY